MLPLPIVSRTVVLFVFLFSYRLLTRAWGESLKTSQMEILSPKRLSLIYETKQSGKSPKTYTLHTQWLDGCLFFF